MMDRQNLVSIVEITIRRGQKEIRLTLDEGRQFRDALIELMGPKVGDMPLYTQQPVWIDPNSEEWPNKWELEIGEHKTARLTINI